MNFVNSCQMLPGTITAGNASKLNDGACALLLVNHETLKKFNLNPLAKIVGELGLTIFSLRL